MPYVTTRRNFLQGGAATALAFWLRRAEAFAQGAVSPKRFLVIHHPVGTVRDNWLCKGSETDFTLSRILMPFTPVKEHMVVLDGMDIIARGAGGGHEQGTVTVMTGLRTKSLYPGNGGDDPKSEGPSIDQRFLKESPALQGTPIASLQVSCDDRVDVAEVSTRRLSYSGAAAPMAPYLVPHLTYERVFSGMMPGGSAATEELRRARRLPGLRLLPPGVSRVGELVVRGEEGDPAPLGHRSTSCRNAARSPLTASGASRFEMCPAPGTTTLRAFGILTAM